MDDSLSDFLHELTGPERLINLTTVRNYRADVNSVLQLAAEQGETPATVSRETVRAWLRQRAECVSPATRRRQLSALRTFFGWMVATGRRNSNPTTEIRGPRREWKLPHVLSIDEASRLLESPSTDSTSDVRARAILEVLYGSGMRVGELRALNVGDLMLSSGQVFIQNGKGHKDRLVPMGMGAIRALRVWLPRRQRVLHDFGRREQGAAFVNFRDGGRLDTRSIARVVREAGRRAGLRQKAHPHLLRHSCFTHLIDRGADLLAVKEQAGHESISTTEIYLRLAAPSRFRKVIEECHPRGA